MTDTMLARATAVLPEMVAHRRQFHQHPELGMEEFETAAAVAAALRALDIEVRERVGGTGVVGLIRGRRPGRTIAIRADMDALPVQEQPDRPYSSRVAGKMHACGHDGHTAILLGVGTLLHGLRGEFDGQVKLLFQPAEEGPGGAQPMIADAAMENPHVDAVIGLHINTEIPTGRIGVGHGVTSAAPDGFQITIRGVGGHGAHPHRSVDAIAVGCQVVTALQTIVSREVDPVNPLVITVGTFQGGFRGNVIAPEVTMTGTVRTLDPELRVTVESRMRRLAGGICAAMRAELEMQYSYGYPSVVNEEGMCRLVEAAGRSVLGQDKVLLIPKPSMGGEDFSYFAQLAPGCFFRLGARNESRGMVLPGHHPGFDFDEECMPVGAAVMVRAALDYLGSGG
ncbi:MAG: amidohydrolase [Bacillota bacterium]|nr:amidohydrolase [Bacillota bacterium]